MFTSLHTLQNGSIRGMSNVNDHTKTIHFGYDFSTQIIDSTPAAYVIAGIYKSIGGVMCGKLYRSKAQAIKRVEQIDIPVHVPRAFQIKESRHFAFLINALDIRGI